MRSSFIKAKPCLARYYYTTSSSRSATLSDTSTKPLKLQPFIPRPISRQVQVKSLSKATPHSTTIHLLAANGRGEESITIPNLFLRDSSIHPAHLHPDNKQKLFRTSDIPIDGELIGYGVHEIDGKDCLVTEWNLPLKGWENRYGPEKKLAVVPVQVFQQLVEKQASKLELPRLKVWDQKVLEPELRFVNYEEFKTSDRALHKTLTSLIETGLTFFKNVPTNPKEGEHTELRHLVERIGSLKRTWYGDLWDVKAEEGSFNIAYTNLDLGLHMDLVHFETPPRFQFLQSLQNDQVKGGKSYFVDSYHIVSLIRKADPEAYEALCTIPVLFEYKNGGKHTRWLRPTVELANGDNAPALHPWAVNYAPPFQGPFPISASSEDEHNLVKLHRALLLFADLSQKEENQFLIQLEPGDCVLFDNRRVLHARTAFEFTGKDGGNDNDKGRWLKGAYMDGDELWSKWRVLQQLHLNEGLQ